MNGAKDYESKVLQVSSIIGEAQVAKDQGNLQLVDQRAAQAREVVGAVSETVSQLSKVAATIASAPKSGSQPSGRLATEKHRFRLRNFSGTVVTISFNGAWVGQWDATSDFTTLESVVQGKNELTVEFQSQPQGTVEISVDAERSDGWVNLVTLNFQGKAAGRYTFSFIAR
jgi:hypothetical protein